MQIIRAPLIMFPLVLASLSDALVALRRISKFLISEELVEPYTIDDGHGKMGMEVDGDFTWETAGELAGDAGKGVGKGKGPAGPGGKKGPKPKGKKTEEPVLPVANVDATAEDEDVKEKEDEKPFDLKNLALKVPRGAFVAIVGRVGSGKVRSSRWLCLSSVC